MNGNAQKFKEWHGQIYNNYLDAKVHWEIYWLLHNSKYIKFVNRNREFFKFEERAHLLAGTLAITRIFDTDPRSISLEQFLKFSLTNREDIEKVFPKCKFCNKKKSQQIEKEIDGLEEDLKVIKAWRNKLIAHEERNFGQKSIKWGAFQKIIDFLERNILDYGSKPNQIFVKADFFTSEIERFFDKHFK